MATAFLNLWLSFFAGLSAPFLAVCILPLYPGFLAYLANQASKGGEIKKSTYVALGLMVTVGIITSMFVFGLIFTTILQGSLTNAIGIVSPIAFGILFIVSIFMIFNYDLGKFFPQVTAPVTKKPMLSSFIFGLFFGAIVLPCNPGSLIVLFALSSSTIGFITNLLNFILFGFGMALPLLLFTLLSGAKSQKIIGSLTKHKKSINLIAGILMLAISIYYLFFVFKIFG